jgi:GAF domain-containing protein
VDAAGLLLVESNGVLGPAAATDPGVAALEALQTDLDQGPALAAARGLETVSIRDLAVDRRWRRLGWVAADYRVGALLAVPVLADEDRPDDTVAAGVVELVINHPHRWTGEEVRAAVAHGATLSRLLRAGLAAGQANERLAHLLRVLDSRVVVEQAKGMLMERDQLLPAQAFRVLRAMAKLSNRRISDVAADVIADRAR